MKILSSDVQVRWAVHTADTGRIEYIDGIKDSGTLPHPDEVITRPFLVHPTSKEPMPVRVVEILENFLDQSPPFLVVVVSLPH